MNGWCFSSRATIHLRDRIRDLLGNELLARLLEVEPTRRGKVQVTGFIGQVGSEPGEPHAAVHLS